MLDVEKDRLEISRGSTSEAGELVQTVSVSIREESTVSWSIEITTSDPSYINAALQLKSGTGCALCEALAAAITSQCNECMGDACGHADGDYDDMKIWLTDVAGVTETAATRIAWHLDSVTQYKSVRTLVLAWKAGVLSSEGDLFNIGIRPEDSDEMIDPELTRKVADALSNAARAAVASVTVREVTRLPAAGPTCAAHPQCRFGYSAQASCCPNAQRVMLGCCDMGDSADGAVTLAVGVDVAVQPFGASPELEAALLDSATVDAILAQIGGGVALGDGKVVSDDLSIPPSASALADELIDRFAELEARIDATVVTAKLGMPPPGPPPTAPPPPPPSLPPSPPSPPPGIGGPDCTEGSVITIAAPVDKGRFVIEIEPLTCGLYKGDLLVVARDTASEEIVEVLDFGSIILKDPLKFDHPTGTTMEYVNRSPSPPPPTPVVAADDDDDDDDEGLGPVTNDPNELSEEEAPPPNLALIIPLVILGCCLLMCFVGCCAFFLGAGARGKEDSTTVIVNGKPEQQPAPPRSRRWTAMPISFIKRRSSQVAKFLGDRPSSPTAKPFMGESPSKGDEMEPKSPPEGRMHRL